MKKKNQVEAVDGTVTAPKQKKPIKTGKVVTIALVITAAALFIFSKILGAVTPEPAQMVTVAEAQVRDIDETIDTSGFIESSNEKTYFSPVNAVVSECNAELGVIVENGALLLSYDVTDLETAAKQAELTDKAAQSGYANTLQAGSESEAKLAESTANVAQYEQLVANAEADVKYLNTKIAEFNQELTKLTGTGENLSESALKRKGELEDAIFVHQQRLENMQSELTKYNSKLAEYQGEKTSAEAGKLSGNAKAQISAEKELSELNKTSAQKDLELAKAGVTSEFKGIVTDVQAVEGGLATEGAALFTVADISSVKISVTVSKNDLETLKEGQNAVVTIAGKEYMGTVSKINRQAVANQQGTPVITAEITVNETDGDIYLGIEANVVIHTVSAAGVVTIPAQALNTGSDGDFCYVVVNGIVEKRNVTIGANDGEYMEVVEGIKEGEEVITVVTGDLTEGMQVTTRKDDIQDVVEE